MSKKAGIRAVTVVTLSLILVMHIAGCSLIKNVTGGAKSAEKEYAEKVFEYLKNEDIESLCGLFSPKMKKTHDLEKEWEEFFAHMDGKIESYKSIKYQNEGMGKDKNGEIYKEHYGVNYTGARTTSGAVYKEFGYYHDVVNRNDPESEGMTVFTMKDPDTGTWYTVGGETE